MDEKCLSIPMLSRYFLITFPCDMPVSLTIPSLYSGLRASIVSITPSLNSGGYIRNV